MSFDYDLFVIGGGSGGVRAGRLAAQTGAKVALAEEFRMGGTCVIRGCVPKKLMVFASKYGPMTKNARAYGWDMTDGTFHWDRFRPMLTEELERLEGIYQRNLLNSGADLYKSRATVTGPNSVKLASGEEFTAKTILVATGGRPFVPDIPGAELGITSNEVFSLPEFPKDILIVGGGYIACEFACIYNNLGADVCLWYRGDKILRGFDGEVRELLAETILNDGIALENNLELVKLEKDGDRIRATGSDGRTQTYDQVVFATGRLPNTQGLGLEEAGVELGVHGQVEVDAYSRTKVPSIWAVGDVTDRIQLTPVAIREGAAFVETVFNDNPTKPDHHMVATAVFTQPEYGTVGMSEEEAMRHGPADIYTAAFRPMQHSFIGKDEKVIFKLVVEQTTHKVLGCHIVGEGAGEMIQLAAVALKMGATKQDFDATVAVHPTMAEEIVLMKTPTRQV